MSWGYWMAQSRVKQIVVWIKETPLTDEQLEAIREAVEEKRLDK
jgi:predicted DNA binding protein